MQNWSGEQNNAMRGYIIYAVKQLNEDSREENGTDAIPAETLKELFLYLRRATDAMTADNAQNYYFKNDF